jgi:sec-independent protein translocase protein TatA
MDLGPWEIAIIAVVILVLFGSAKLPQAARSLGRSMRIFKSETKGLINSDDDEQSRSQSSDAHEQAARLREQAARLEQQAGHQQLNPPSSEPSINGVPLSQTEHGKQS